MASDKPTPPKEWRESAAFAFFKQLRKKVLPAQRDEASTSREVSREQRVVDLQLDMNQHVARLHGLQDELETMQHQLEATHQKHKERLKLYKQQRKESRPKED